MNTSCVHQQSCVKSFAVCLACHSTAEPGSRDAPRFLFHHFIGPCHSRDIFVSQHMTSAWLQFLVIVQAPVISLNSFCLFILVRRNLKVKNRTASLLLVELGRGKSCVYYFFCQIHLVDLKYLVNSVLSNQSLLYFSNLQ